MERSVIIAIVLVLVRASSAAADSDQPPFFVTGSFFSGVERLSHVSGTSPTIFNDDLSGTTTGAMVGVGTFLAERVSVQLDFAFPSALSTTVAPVPASLPPGPVFSVRTRTQIDYRTRTAALLVGYQTPTRHRVRFGYLGGVAWIQERRHTVTDTSLPVPSPFPPPRTELTAFTYRSAPAVGFDVQIAVTSHLAAVPQVRAHWFLGALSVRPGVGIRWNF